ncbi:sulfotransferase family protein [Streptomyces phaeochromogenes]
MLDVFGAGFGRTGTLSLKTALEILGLGPCHHMRAVHDSPDQIPLWQRAAHGEAVDWRAVYAGYRSSVDWPGARFWREITGAFPEAKVILTVRDAHAWYESARSSIYAAVAAPPPDPAAAPLFTAEREMSKAVVWDGVFDGRFEDEAYAVKVYEEHNAAVRRELDPGRLLVFEVGQGWQPLCDFLGVPVPDEPFPRSNDRAEFARFVEELRGKGPV